MNSLAFQVVVSILPLLGIAGIIGGYITHLLGRNWNFRFLNTSRNAISRVSYSWMPTWNQRIPNISQMLYKSIEDERDLAEWLKMEYYEMLFYAPASVALSVKEFIDAPSRDQFLKTILVMRSARSG